MIYKQNPCSVTKQKMYTFLKKGNNKGIVKGGVSMMYMFIFLLLFFSFQSVILFCCAAAGNDPASQALSDQEQMEYIAQWKEKHSNKTKSF